MKLSYESGVQIDMRPTSGHCFLMKFSKTDRSKKFYICNIKHEYGTIGYTMVLLKHIDKPSLFLSYEQQYIQLFQHNKQLIPEKKPNEQNPMFQLL